MQLKIEIRHTQYLAVEDSPTQGLVFGQPIVYAGQNPTQLHPVAGAVPVANYFDITGDTANLDKISFTWTTERDGDGVIVSGLNQAKRTASNAIQIEGAAYLFIKEWLVDSVSAPLNGIDVRVTDTSCGIYDEWIIKAPQVSWCADDICEFSVTIQQKDPSLQCIQSTLISDNWQGWFQDQPLNGKKHPRFSYCNEVKPNGMMITLWWLMSLVFTILILLTPIINTIIAIINVIIAIINAIAWITGQDPVDYLNFFNPLNMAESFFMESSGCGRLHPAPLNRDYIDNVCKKCGVHVDNLTDPLFHSTTLNIDLSSDRQVRQRPNPYYNSCYLNAPIKRGIRIFRGLFNNDQNLVDYYIQDNRPILSLDMFLDELGTLYNCRWRIKNVNGQPTLYFWRKDWFKLGSAIYNFTDNGEDRNKIIEGICFSWLDKKQFAYMRGLYGEDAADTCGTEALQYMNDMISLGDKTNNPNYDGFLDKTTKFGGTRFRLDGASDDYLANAMQTLLNGAALNPTIPAIVNEAIVPAVEQYADYALLFSGETATLPKVVIWDESTGYDFAKAVRTKSTMVQSVNGSSLPLPTPNTVYNESSLPWYYYHFPQTYVTGSALSFGSSPIGKYTVQEYFGIDFYARPAELCNYPMFFSSKFTENIYDFFHWIDDTRINPSTSREWTLKIELCCEDLQKLKVLNDSSEIELGATVLLPTQFYNEGEITEITVDYDSSNEVGKNINLKGVV